MLIVQYSAAFNVLIWLSEYLDSHSDIFIGHGYFQASVDGCVSLFLSCLVTVVEKKVYFKYCIMVDNLMHPVSYETTRCIFWWKCFSVSSVLRLLKIN